MIAKQIENEKDNILCNIRDISGGLNTLVKITSVCLPLLTRDAIFSIFKYYCIVLLYFEERFLK